jgi:hypothetical protein
MRYRKIIAVSSEIHAEHISAVWAEHISAVWAEHRMSECESWWYIQ